MSHANTVVSEPIPDESHGPMNVAFIQARIARRQAWVADLYNSGYPLPEIKRMAGVSDSTVDKDLLALRRKGLVTLRCPAKRTAQAKGDHSRIMPPKEGKFSMLMAGRRFEDMAFKRQVWR